MSWGAAGVRLVGHVAYAWFSLCSMGFDSQVAASISRDSFSARSVGRCRGRQTVTYHRKFDVCVLSGFKRGDASVLLEEGASPSIRMMVVVVVVVRTCCHPISVVGRDGGFSFYIEHRQHSTFRVDALRSPGPLGIEERGAMWKRIKDLAHAVVSSRHVFHCFIPCTFLCLCPCKPPKSVAFVARCHCVC